MQTYEYHRYADVFPLMTDQEYRELVDDIRTHGQREPITIYQKKILDGRNRERACAELGIKWLYVDFEGDDAAALDFVVSANMVRRHLTTSQRAMIAADLATLRQGQRKSDASNEATQVETAKQMHVSRPSVQRARKVNQKGTPELAASVRRGEISVSAAAAQIDAKAATNGHADDAAEADTPDNSEDDIAPPDQIEDNVLYAIARVADNARAVRKILKASALDRKAAERVIIEINRMIQKWRLVLSTLEKQN
jgi:ParB-like chromosome segregation protein Spo0J